MNKPLLTCMAIASLCAVLEPAPAAACGGCFVQPSITDRTVVTDHRMALSVSPTQTVLWDQIRYSGDPAEFAWVLPVRSGARLELSNDAFFTALDASTQPVVISPTTYGGGVGCGLAGCASQTANSDATGAPGQGQVQILSQSVVGPYETVTLRATDPGALRNWLKGHAYDIPDTIAPTIDAYVAEQFDFLALRLRPDCGQRAMQPVRIVTNGADPTLPLRMVAAGAGARVGLTLYVISEGRYQPSNFPHAQIEPSKVLWDRVASQSNYETLTNDLMTAGDGRTWVAEYAQQPQLFTVTDPRYGGSFAPSYQITGNGSNITPGLADAYYAQCKAPGAITPRLPSASGSTSTTPDFTPCPNAADASTPPTDAGIGTFGDGGVTDASTEPDADAGVDPGDDGGTDLDGGTDPDATAADAGPEDDGGNVTPPTTTPPSSSSSVCLYLDDLDVALRGLHPRDVWVTRYRASLSPSTLTAGDLKLEASSSQTPISNVYYASAYTDETPSSFSNVNGSSNGNGGGACVSAPKRRTAFGSWMLAIATGLALVSMLRRRTRR